jgi:hypothetical protein
MFIPNSNETNFQNKLKNSLKSVEIIREKPKEIYDLNDNSNKKIYMNNGNVDTEAFPNNNINSSKKKRSE